MTRASDIAEVTRQKASMSQRVQVKDSTYGLYAGNNPVVALEMARIDTMLDVGLVPAPLIPFVKIRRKLLNQYRKAYMASSNSEITTLGFLLGLKSEYIDGVEEYSEKAED